MIAAATWLGSVPTWALLIVAAASARAITKGKSGEAVEILQGTNKVLSDRIDVLEKQGKRDAVLIADLQSRTDYSMVMKQHESNAVARTEGILKVLDLIAKRLGAEE